MRTFTTMWATCLVGVVTGCLYGLRARSRHPVDLGTHVSTALSDPRPWAYVLLPTIVLVIAWRARWHGSPEVLGRHGSRRQQALTGLAESARSTLVSLMGLLAGLAASGTGLPATLSTQPAAEIASLLLALGPTTIVVAALVAWVTHRHTGLGLAVAGVLLLWGICEIGLPSLIPSGGPVSWGLPDTSQGLSLRHAAPLMTLAVLWSALQGLHWWRHRGDLLLVLLTSTLWTLAAPRLIASPAPDAQDQLVLTWWGHGGGLFDPLVYTAHWLVTSLPVLLVLNTWDRPWLQQAPSRVLRHGSPGPLACRALEDAAHLSLAGAFASTVTALALHGSLTPSGAVTTVEFALGWFTHTVFWCAVGLTATWWSGNPLAGQLSVLATLLLAPLAPWSRTGLPLGLAALGQQAAFSPALLWPVPAALGLILVLHHSPVPGQGRDL